MLRIYSGLFSALLIFSDIVVIMGAWALAFYARFTLPILPITKGFPAFHSYMALSPLIILLWYLIFNSRDLYRSHRLTSRTDELGEVLKAHAFALLIFVTMTSLISDYRYSRAVMIGFAFISILGLVFNRLVIRNVLRKFRRRGYNLRYALVIGNTQAAREIIYKIRHGLELGIRLQGTITSDGKPIPPTEHWLENIPLLGSYQDLWKQVRENAPDLIFICLSPLESRELLESHLKKIAEEPSTVMIVPDLAEYTQLGCAMEEFDGLPILNINKSPITGFNRVIKRVFDVVFSFCVLIFLSPLFLLIAVLVKTSSSGPILYRQKRMGLDGEEFDLLKFRSMPIGSESATGPVWATQNDNRPTPIGRFLRKSNLDELPQFFNVLVGQMSVVGPRPERPFFVSQFREQVPSYMLRHKVRSGLTGWAQVNGWRGNTSIERRIEHDLYYIKNWSFLLDLRIIFLTVLRGFVDKNAY